jgi:hypothetical protein
MAPMAWHGSGPKGPIRPLKTQQVFLPYTSQVLNLPSLAATERFIVKKSVSRPIKLYYSSCFDTVKAMLARHGVSPVTICKCSNHKENPTFAKFTNNPSFCMVFRFRKLRITVAASNNNSIFPNAYSTMAIGTVIVFQPGYLCSQVEILNRIHVP